MSTATLISEQQYLSTEYEYPPEYVEGQLRNRPLPTFDHSLMQAALIEFFRLAYPHLRALPELRYHVAERRYRLPDLVVVPRSFRCQGSIETVPLIVIEILSPDDRSETLLEKLNEYRAAGVPYIWVLDPETRLGYQDDLTRRDILTAESVSLNVREFFEKL